MTKRLGRRQFITALCAGLAYPAARALTPAEALEQLRSLEREIGGRIGVAALDEARGMRLAYRDAERFAMCSTFKLLLAAEVLAQADAGVLRLDQPVRYTRAALLSNSPLTAAHAAQGSLPLLALLQAAVEVSDNTAANLLLGLSGGPEGLTRYLRSQGDTVTRLDRVEPALNENLPQDPRDTTTPAAMLENLRRLVLGRALSPASAARLTLWMRNCTSGSGRLRAALPSGWQAGDKTGTGRRGAVNDVAVFWPPAGRRALVIASYLSGSTEALETLGHAHARIGAIVLGALAPNG